MASIKRAGASLGVGQISLILCAQILAGEEKGGMTFLMSFISFKAFILEAEVVGTATEDGGDGSGDPCRWERRRAGMCDVKDVMWGEVDGELSRGEVVTGEVVGELIASLSDTSVRPPV